MARRPERQRATGARTLARSGGRSGAGGRRAGGRGGRGRGDPPRKSGWRWLRRLVVFGMALAVIGAIALGLSVFFAARSLPSYSQLKNTATGQTIVVRARDGSEIIELGPSYGEWLPSYEIPGAMKDAMVAVEDRRFFYHPGVDAIGLGRAVYQWLWSDRRLEATSTITQQLARNLFLNSNRSFDRKAREAILALALEWKFSKQQILELYLNKVYFGGGAYGIDSASRRFFSHPGRTLDVGEAAIIAGLVKAPSRFSPTADVDAAVDRANTVLMLMRQQGMISAGEADVDPADVNIRPEPAQNSARYFTDWALPQLDVLLPETFEPIEVWTTIDIGLQDAATAAVKANVPRGSQGALVSLDADGAVLAMVGGTDYVTSNYNRATTAVRQPGSAWKLFVYLAALEAGYQPDDRVVDRPVTIQGWSPRNSGGSYAGEIDVRAAFAYSKNTVAAQLGNEVGFGTVASMARRFGITTPISTVPSMVLGSNEVRVIDLTRAFAALGGGGNSLEPYGIVRVTTTGGRTLYQHEDTSVTQLVPDYVAAEMTDLLQTAVATGTGRAAQIGRPVAGKTGTTSSNKDGWFLGFSSGITTGVWMGRDDARPVQGLQGGTAPARAFAAYMRHAVKDRPVVPFDTAPKLPEWQLEPDDQFLFGEPQEYYFVDENGDPVDPAIGPGDRFGRGSADGRDRSDRPQAAPPRPFPTAEPPPAASDDFLDRALGRSAPPAPRGPSEPVPGTRRVPPPTPLSRDPTRRAPPPDPTAGPRAAIEAERLIPER